MAPEFVQSSNSSYQFETFHDASNSLLNKDVVNVVKLGLEGLNSQGHRTKTCRHARSGQDIFVSTLPGFQLATALAPRVSEGLHIHDMQGVAVARNKNSQGYKLQDLSHSPDTALGCRG